MIDGANDNVSFTCNTLISATATAYGDFTLRIYAIDSATNENSTSQSFTLTASSGTTTPGGGSTTTIVGTAETFAILSISYQDNVDVSLAKDSVKSRRKEFLIVNTGIEQISVTLECSIEGINRTKEGVNICDYIVFNKTTLLVSPNEKEPTLGYFEILTPPNSSIGDQFYFNIIGTSTEGNSKLSVSTEVKFLAFIYKWSSLSSKEVLESGEELIVSQKMYPVWIPALIGSLIVLFGTFALLRKRAEGTGIFLGLILSFVAFFVILWLL